jgi:integrase/recombinase XerD
MPRHAEATLWMLIKVARKKRYVRAERTANGRYIPTVKGPYEPGPYYLRYTLNGKRKWESVGGDLNIALQEQKARQASFETSPSTPSRTLSIRKALAEAITKFIAHKNGPGRLARRRTQSWKWLLDLFSKWWDKTYVDEFNREDFQAFQKYLARKGKQPRTQHNMLHSLVTFFRASGRVVLFAGDEQKATIIAATTVVSNTLILMSADMPKFTKRKVMPYSEEKLDGLFAAADPWEKLFMSCFLFTGMREQEVSHLYWRDINWGEQDISVTAKPELEWTTKAYEERTIEAPVQLMELLRDAYQHREDNGLIFSNKEGRPEGHFLDSLQKVAYRTGITCGVCSNCKTRKGRNCHAFGLHKFRKTFATKLSQAGVPIQDIKEALGHADIQTTMDYLGVSPKKRRRENVAAAFPQKIASQVVPSDNQLVSPPAAY